MVLATTLGEVLVAGDAAGEDVVGEDGVADERVVVGEELAEPDVDGGGDDHAKDLGERKKVSAEARQEEKSGGWNSLSAMQ